MEIDPEKIALRDALFLHGSIIVEAAPGTGKTFAGVYLAREVFRNGWTNKDHKTLFLTFSKNARVQIEDEIDSFSNDKELSKAERESIKASNYHSFFYEFMQNRRGFWGIKKLRPATLKESKERTGSPLKIAEGIKHGTPRYVDFALMFFRLMQHCPTFLEWLQKSYPFVILDEFQDSDAIQWDILKLWKPKHIAIFYDRFQMIYEFRDATLGNVQNAIREYSIPTEAQLGLNKGYRISDGNTLLDYILELRSDGLLGQNITRPESRPWLSLKIANPNQNPSVSTRCASQIRYMNRDINHNETTAVITRGNSLASSLQKSLTKKSTSVIPWYTCCKLMSGEEDADEELRVMISTLRDHNTDKNLRKWYGELFDHLLITPVKISGTEIKFAKQFSSKKNMLAGRRDPLLQVMRNDFCAMFDSITKDNFVTISNLYDYILKYSFKLVESTGTLDPDWLYYIRQFAKATKTCQPNTAWDEYCDKLESTLLKAGHCRRHMNGGLTILNAHQSKGRQFDHVILAWLSQSSEAPFKGTFPCYDYNSEQDRKLLYVALTRAKKKVTIVYPQESPSDILSQWKLI